MYLALIGPQYLLWHYTAGIVDLFRVWRNLTWATAHFFSLWLMLTTLVSPWKRMVEHTTSRFDIKQHLVNFTLNVMSRFVGLTIRLAVLLIGSVTTSIVGLCGIVVFVGWLLAPFLVVAAAGFGFYFLIHSIV